ncbi:unnamed protein product, partial [Ectocarpus sp. 12 AP-2014]
PLDYESALTRSLVVIVYLLNSTYISKHLAVVRFPRQKQYIAHVRRGVAGGIMIYFCPHRCRSWTVLFRAELESLLCAETFSTGARESDNEANAPTPNHDDIGSTRP